MKQKIAKFLVRGSSSNKIPSLIRSLFVLVNKIFKNIFLNEVILKDFDEDISIVLYPNYSLGQRDYFLYHSELEKDLFYFLRNFLKPGMTIIDIGANIGYYALFFSKYIGSTGKVISFEATKRTFDQLNKNIRLNSFSNIQTHNLAISNKKETLTIYMNNFNDGENSLIKNTDNSTGIPTQAVTLDDFWFNDQKEKISDKIDLIKIDIEGWEVNALEGMKKLIEKYSPAFVMEFNGYKYKNSSIEAYNFLRSRGYKCYKIENSKLTAIDDSNLKNDFNDQFLDLVYFKD